MMQYQKSDALGPLDEDDSDAEDEEQEEEEDEDDFEYVDDETEEGEEYDGEYIPSDDENYQTGPNFSNISEPVASPALNNFSLNNLNDSVAFVGEENRPNTVETFCNTTVPTLAMFNALEENDKVLAFKTFLHVSFKCIVVSDNVPNSPIYPIHCRAFPKKITSFTWYSPS